MSRISHKAKSEIFNHYYLLELIIIWYVKKMKIEKKEIEEKKVKEILESIK